MIYSRMFPYQFSVESEKLQSWTLESLNVVVSTLDVANSQLFSEDIGKYFLLTQVNAGTTIEMPEVYCRVEFAGIANGTTLEVATFNYASKIAFKEGANSISTNVPNGNFTVELKEGEMQTIENALAYTQVALESAGYEVVNLLK